MEERVSVVTAFFSKPDLDYQWSFSNTQRILAHRKERRRWSLSGYVHCFKHVFDGRIKDL
jgi:hypothetical protein